MPSEKFTMKTSNAAVNGSVKKGGVVCTVAFAAVTAEGISTSWYFSGPEEPMKKLFASWPVNFDDVKGMILNPIDVEGVISTITATAAGAQNTIAQQNAQDQAAEAAKAEAATKAQSMADIGKQIESIAK